jgi:hypothetical protein
MAHKYEGHHLAHSPVRAADFARETAVVAVTGARWNPCGHLLLNVGGRQGWYFHAVDIHAPPRAMGLAGYLQYLKDFGKTEVWRKPVKLPNPDGAARRLEDVIRVPYHWLLLPNNCVHWVEIVLRGGGSDEGMMTNCPLGELWVGADEPQPLKPWEEVRTVRVR